MLKFDNYIGNEFVIIDLEQVSNIFVSEGSFLLTRNVAPAFTLN